MWTLYRSAMLDQALDSAEGGRPLPQLDPCGAANRRGFAAFDPDREHAAEAALHLAPGQRMLRMAGEPGIEHLGDGGVALEVLGEMKRVHRALLDPER